MAVCSIRTASLWSEPDFITNPVNCVGVMGAGIAKEFALSFPLMLELYKIVCKRKVLWPGDVLIYYTDKYAVFNVATKGHFKYRSNIQYIKDIVRNLNHAGLEKDDSIGMPKIGAGHGGLNWNSVQYELNKLTMCANIYTGDFRAMHQSETKGIMHLVTNETIYTDVLAQEDYDETRDYVNTIQASKLHSNGRRLASVRQ